jgi:predicted house-cleaning NTP pyrophosphatase (Maf/HAM1 superfamily)
MVSTGFGNRYLKRYLDSIALIPRAGAIGPESSGSPFVEIVIEGVATALGASVEELISTPAIRGASKRGPAPKLQQ